jgi:flagellar basal body rod protein FlgC
MSKTIRTSNNLTIDATGDIILDADNADVKLQDGGTEFGRISRVTSDLVIKSMGDNNDILLKGLDGGSTITALQLDMSENGNAIFSGDITATDITANSLTTNVISSNGSNAGISIQPSGSGEVLLGALRLNGTTLDTNDSSAITIGEEINFEGAVNLSGGDLITGNNRISFNDQSSGTVSFLDFTVTQFSQTNNTVLSSVKSINFFLDSNGGDSGQAFRIYNNTNPDGSPTENTYIFKVDESGDLFVTGDTSMTGTLTATDITANSLTTNVISSNGSNAELSLQASGTGDVVVSALRVNGTTLDSADSTKITVAEDVDVTGTLFSRGNVFGVQTLTGSGSTEVVNLTDTVTLLVTTGGSQAFSLANGTEGQLKIISMKTDGGSGIVTPASFVNGSSITFDDVEDTIVLMYQSTGWVVLARQNSTVNA